MKAIDNPQPEQALASTSQLQEPAPSPPPASQGRTTRSQVSKAPQSKAPASKTSLSSPSRRSRRRGLEREKGIAEEEQEVTTQLEPEDDEPRPRRSEKGKGKEVEGSSSSDEGENQEGMGDLMIYKRTRSHSRALEDERKAVHKNLSEMAGRSVKKSHAMRIAKGVQKVIIDLTGDVSRVQLYIRP